MKKLFRLFSSLKLAVVVLMGLTASLATATFIESLYDTRTAQYWVYRSWWFTGLLGLLWINILCVALSRIPWKPKHTPFLMAHLGILMLLIGSFITQKYSLDGNMRITEGDVSNTVELEDPGLVVIDSNRVTRMPVEWIPPEVSFNKISVKDRGLPYDLTIDQYLTHADPQYNFVEDKNRNPLAGPAVQVKLVGGRMAIQQEYWLWTGDPSWRNIQAGPATLIFGVGTPPVGHPSLMITPDLKGGIQYTATSSEGKKVSGSLPGDKIAGFNLNPGWHGDVQIVFEKWVQRGVPLSSYVPSRIQRGQGAPMSAIHLVAGQGGEGSELWLGMGERAALTVGGRQVELGYYPEQAVLPFQVKLEHFKVDHYDGTRDPSEYSSVVSVLDKDGTKSALISMNEPLKTMGTTLYQASYEDATPRPITSIFSVNRDPGRSLKYMGSLLIVLGSISLFAMKYRQNKTTVKS